MKKIILLLTLIIGISQVLFTQNAIVGSGFTTGWGSACSNGNDYTYFSASIGTTYTSGDLTPKGTGNQYWRMAVGWSSTYKQLNNTSSEDNLVTSGIKYSLYTTCVSSGALYKNVSSTSNRYVFKTLDTGVSPTGTWVFFELGGSSVSVNNVSQSPSSSSVTSSDVVTVTATLSSSFPAGQGAYLRYTTDSWSTSTVVSMSGSGTSYTGTIPAQISGKTVSYYVFTSGSGLTISSADANLYTINWNAGSLNGGSNYSYTVSAAASAPTVTTTSISNITSTSASSGGTVTSNGGSSVTAEGVCWNTTGTPTTADSKTTDGTSTPFTSSLSSLSAQTKYYVRAYATNSVGTGYAGSDLPFYTLSSPATAGSFAWGTNSGCGGSAVLNWTGATFPGSGATTKGYVLLRATSPNTPVLGNSNGAAPTAGSNTTIVSSTLSSSATTYTDAPTSGSTYVYLLVPFTWDGTNAATYNYLTTLSTTSVAVSSGVTWLGGTSTDWGTASNWCGGVPTSSTDVTIPSGTTYSPTVSSGAVAKTVTINSGATLNGGTNTLTVSGNFTNNGTFTAATGTVVFNASATISGTVAFNNLTTGVSLNLGTATTVNGTFQLNSGYSLSGTAPIYGASSTLKYNSGGSPGRGLEWSASGAGTIGTTVGYPNNVQVSNNTTLNCNNGSTTTRAIAGNLTIDSGSSLYCDYSGGSCALIVGKNITMAGNLSLGVSSGGDLTLGGNFTKNGGQLNTNGRAVTFNGTSGQTISGSGSLNGSGNIDCFTYMSVANGSGGSITLNIPVNVSNTLNLNSGIVTTTSTNILYVSSNATGAVSGGSATSFVNGPLKRANGTSGEYKFPVGVGTTYLPCSVTNPSASTNITAQAFASGSGGSLAGYDISTTEYWKITADVSATGTVSLARATVSPYTSVATGSTVNGSYTNLNGSTTSTLISSNTIAAGSSSNVNTSTYYAFCKVTSAIYYYKSSGDVTWSSSNNWLVSTDGVNYATTSTAPSAVSVYNIIVQSGNTLSISSTATTPVSANFFVNGTLEFKSGGSVSTAPTYGASSTLKYNDSGTRSVGTEWSTFTDTSNATDTSVPTSAGVGNPANVEVTAGTVNETLISSYDKHLFIADDFIVRAGATINFTMIDTHVSTGWATKGLIVGDSIINYGSVNTVNDNTHQSYKCGTFINESTGTWILGNLPVGNDMYTSGDFMNWNSTYNSVNFNGRALILYGSKNPQTIGGSASQPLYEIDYLIVSKDAGTMAVSQKNLYCSGYANGQAGGGAITVSSGILDLSDRTVQIADNQTNNFSTITMGTTGYLRTNSGTKLYILGNETTKNTGTLRFDQTTPGTTNVIGVLRLNRSNSQAELDVANGFIVNDSLRVQQGLLKSTADIQLNSTAVGVLSSANSTAQLTVNNLVFCKTSTKSAEFYKNVRTLTINGKVRAKVTFDQTGKWHFISFPYAVSNVYKSDGTTPAVLGTDYSLGEYDASKRALNVSGWKSSTDNPMAAGKGYIINKKSTLEDLYFDGSVTGSDAMFNSTNTKTLTYTPSSICDCDAGWNFIAHPLSASATPALSSGEFAYSYDASKDSYKLWYYENNKGYTYGSSSLRPFDAFFVKTPSPSAVTLSYSGYTNPIQNVKSETPSSEDVITLNLTANNTQYETFVRILNDATANYDVMYDAPYSTPMSGTTPRMYSLIGSDMYALNSVPEVSQVPVGVRLPASGSYSFNWTISSPTLPVTLTDKTTGVVTDLSSVDSYNFTSDVSGDINDRFILNIGKKVVTVVPDDSTNGVVISGGDKQVDIKGLSAGDRVLLYDASGRLLKNVKTNDSYIVVPVPDSGVYMLEIDSNHANPLRSKVVVF